MASDDDEARVLVMHDTERFHVYLLVSSTEHEGGWEKLSYGTMLDLATGQRLFEHRTDVDLEIEKQDNRVALVLRTTKTHLRSRKEQIDEVARVFSAQEYSLFQYNCRTAAFTMLVCGMDFSERKIRKLFLKAGIRAGIPRDSMKGRPLDAPVDRYTSLQEVVNEPLTILLYATNVLSSAPLTPN